MNSNRNHTEVNLQPWAEQMGHLINYLYHCPDDLQLIRANCFDPTLGTTPSEHLWAQATSDEKNASIHHAASIPNKVRQWGFDPFDTPTEQLEAYIDEHLQTLTEEEHERWNQAKLAEGYRPLNDEERKQFDLLIDAHAPYQEIVALKKKYRDGSQRAHLDICSFEDLIHYDAPAIFYDELLVKAIPYLLKQIQPCV